MRVLILGVGGQDGSYLAEHLVATGHTVHGLARDPARCRPLPGVTLHTGDLLDRASLHRVLAHLQPDEVYNLAAVTAPGASWGRPHPHDLAHTTALGVVHLLDAILAVASDARLVHASSSAIYEPDRYGLYGAAKRFAHDTVCGYRTGYGLHASTAILFSHTSPRQSPRFLARQITGGVARIATGQQTRLSMSNLANRRDWGYAPDYMRALPLIARRDSPGDYDINTGLLHSVGDLVAAAFAAIDIEDWAAHVEVTGAPTEPDEVRRPTASARNVLGWAPRVPFDVMAEAMVRAELAALRAGGW